MAQALEATVQPTVVLGNRPSRRRGIAARIVATLIHQVETSRQRQEIAKCPAAVFGRETGCRC